MLSKLISRAASASPTKTAIVCGCTRLTYPELQHAIERCAAGMSRLGVGAGDCVVLVLPNRAEFVIAFFATLRLGAILAPLSPHAKMLELERFVADAAPKMIICDPLRMTVCRHIAQGLLNRPTLIVTGKAGELEFDRLGDNSGPAPQVGTPENRALYLYTSGSTDTYKRVCCNQRNLWFEALNFVQSAGLSAEDTILCTVPLYHSYGIGNCLLDAAYAGATLVMLERSESEVEPPFGSRVPEVARLIRDETIRFYPAAPHQLSVLASATEIKAGAFADVRLCVSSGDVLPRSVFDRFFARFGKPIRSLYGSTEAGSIAMDCGPADAVRFGSLGPPLANIEIQIRDKAGCCLGFGVQGAIWVKSPVIPTGLYDNRPELTQLALCDGFYDTGDVGVLDPSGALVMTGRKQSFVDIAGYKVDLLEIEEALQACPGVSDAAAVAIDVPHMGALVKAVVVATEACTDSVIQAHCKARLAFFKTPRIVERRAALPRSPMGKVLRSELGDVSAYLDHVRRQAGGPVGDLEFMAPAVRRRRLETLVVSQVAYVLALAPTTLRRDLGFVEMGMDSFTAIELLGRLEYLLGRRLPETLTFDYPTVETLVSQIDHLIIPSQTEPMDIATLLAAELFRTGS